MLGQNSGFGGFLRWWGPAGLSPAGSPDLPDSPDLKDMYRRVATYVDQTYRSAKPGDQAIEQLSKSEMVIKMKIAETLGLTFTQSVLRRA